jgi:amidohydrolase
MASSDTFHIVVRGRGAHGAQPHRGIDPIQIAAELVTSLHQIVSRRVEPVEPAVITIGTFQAGTKENVIPDTARLTGTVRAYSQTVRELLHGEIEAVARGVTSAWGASFEMDYTWGYPVLDNDLRMSELAARAAERVLGDEGVSRTRPPIMGAEDFAHYSNLVPGTFAFLGSGDAEVPVSDRPLGHTAGFLMDEAAMPIGLAWYLSLVTSFSELRQGLPKELSQN